MIRKLLIIILILTIPIAVWSQTVRGHVANSDDPRILFVSPAGAALLPSAQIVTGYEMLYTGLGLKNGFAAFSSPHQRFGAFSVIGQYFLSDIYRTGNFNIGYGRALLDRRFCLGLELGVISFSYNSDNFRLNDLNDPVFRNGASKTTLDLGVSVLANPIDPVFLGMSLRHLNQPNISLIGDNVRMPIKFQAGVMLRSAILDPSFDFEYYDGRSTINFAMERWFFDHKFLLRTNYYHFNLGGTVGFVVPVNKNYLRFEYEYRYPLSEISDISNASHLFIIAFGFLKEATSFEISVFPKEQEILAGKDATLRVNISRTGQFNSPIDLMLLSPNNIVPTSVVPQRLKSEKSATFVIRTSKQTPPKDYHFNIIARSGGKEEIVPIRIAVKSAMQAGEKGKPGEKQASILVADVRASVDRLIITETTKIRSRDPLLPYIFFEENQHTLNKDRYHILNPKREPVTKFSFSPEKLFDIPTKYQNTLNVIAKRLRDNPHMEIMVRGYNSDWGIEKGNIELSQRRAESVRDYLVSNCGVRSWQIKAEAFHLPPDPASNFDPRGREENQRAEISCPVSSQPILDPIVTETSEIATSDDSCRFEIINFQAGAGLSKWKLVISEVQGDTFKLIEGNDLLKKVLTWDWKNDAGQSVAVGRSYRYKLLLQDKNGQIFETNWKTIQVEKVSAVEREYIQKNIEKTRLILFKYDRADMDLTSKSLREELALNAQKLKSNFAATLLIQGHTDVIGDPDYNSRLSARRADSVARYFIDRGISRSRITFEGFGMSNPLMENVLPEGRMMNRRVEIYILY